MKQECIECGTPYDPFEEPTQPYCKECYEWNNPPVHCRGRGCEEVIPMYDKHLWARHDYHGISTGYYCQTCYENNYPYRRDDYTHGTGIADDGTPLESN